MHEQALILKRLTMRGVAPDELEELSDVVPRVELVVKLSVRAGDLDLCSQGGSAAAPEANSREQSRLTDVSVDEARHEVLERERVEVDDVSHGSTRIALHRPSEVVHDLQQRSARKRKRDTAKADLDELALKVGVLHVRRREEDEHEGHKLVLRVLCQHLRSVPAAKASATLDGE